MAEKSGDCYIDVWRDADFGGERIRIYGPAEYPTLGFAEGNWGDDIGSLRVGPNAFVMAFRHREFRDKLITFGPNDEVADLSQFKFDDDIESMKVIDSLKIFDRLGYNSPPTAEAPEAEAPEAAPAAGSGRRAPENRHKGRRRPGRKG
ncbi:MAG TPA: hypothetical protein VFZ44_05555 [Pyrinomonadaceae bacterium]